ncbi:hypothetical protein [Halorubellus sp. JP-L1]|nr:hypothetical protein [Halorubellus sp. JP-L1]
MDDDPLVDKDKQIVQYWIEQAAEGAVSETGNKDYRRVSTHDFRRC